MWKTCGRSLFALLTCAALSPIVSYAGDPHVPSTTNSPQRAGAAPAAVRSSPFSPPTDDAFVTDDGPGLDTGCTFRSGSPLVVDVVMDSFVGDVDVNGHLVNPGPLIAKGIIPASVRVEMPAFDIDFNGHPPPNAMKLYSTARVWDSSLETTKFGN